jgi:hypothetical protein
MKGCREYPVAESVKEAVVSNGCIVEGSDLPMGFLQEIVGPAEVRVEIPYLRRMPTHLGTLPKDAQR